MRTKVEVGHLQDTAGVVTGLIAVTAYAGVAGLWSGAISFDRVVAERLPLESTFLAGAALLLFVAVPMTVATAAGLRHLPRSSDLMFTAGALLIGWIAVQLAFIQEYSWFHPAYLAAGLVVLALAWVAHPSER